MLNTKQDQLLVEIQKLIGKYGNGREALIPILQAVQKRYHSISDFSMQVIADQLGIHPVEVYSVVTFYAFLNEKYHGRFVIRLCRTISCDMTGKDAVARQFKTDLGIDFGETTADGRFTLEWANCTGMCDQGPAMLVNDQVFTKVTPQKVHDILRACETVFGPHFSQLEGVRSDREGNTPASRHRNMTLASVEPDAGLVAALKLERAGVIGAICSSGMKGRGGAGFPTGVKWRLAADQLGDRKYVICNADEGEPGTFKDRVILSEWADLVVEGMTIAGYAIGADTGIIYLRGEYEYLRKGLESCLAKRRSGNLLGGDIHGRAGFNFDIKIHMGCGAYICGEETALIESLEGHRGEARNRPPFPVNTGFNGKPTIVNNVETFAWVSAILSKGADWFRKIGTEKSTGPKLFSVSGDIAKPGVYEFPFGITIEALLAEVGGADAKAVIVGGASGICVPAHEFGRGISYEEVSTGGSVIVFGRHRNMLDVAENFLEFFVGESCGQCTPCRIGNIKLLEGVRMLKRGGCSTKYLRELMELGETMQLAAKCGLGQSSPNAFLSIVKHFRHEIMGRAAVLA